VQILEVPRPLARIGLLRSATCCGPLRSAIATAVVLVAAGACAGPSDPGDGNPPAPRGEVVPQGIVRLGAGGSAQLTFLRVDSALGSRDTIRNAVQWSSSDPEVATVDAAGRVTGVAAGYTRIVARQGSLVDSVWAHLALPAPPPSVIHLEFAAGVSEARRRSARRAAARWNEMLQDSLVSVQLALPPSRCGLGVVWPDSVGGEERGLRVLVMASPLVALAGTGICERRVGGLPALAFILASTHPQNDAVDDAWWDRIFLHEIGHALGLVADQLIPPGAPLSGAAMAAGFRHDVGRDGVLTYNVSAHWVGLRGDIMDGETGSNAPVIARTTLGRLRDMGYAVRLRQSGPLDLARLP